MSPKRLKLLSKPMPRAKLTALQIKTPSLNAKALKEPQGKANLTVNSVSSGGKFKLKRTGVKTLDTVSRSQQLAAKREEYNKTRTQHQEAADTPLASLDELEEYGKVQLVTLPNGRQREWHVISPTAAADPLMTTAVTISRWLKAGLLPHPVLESGRGSCYHLEELRSFCQILGAHLTTTKHYRATNTDTKAKLFKENARIREALFETP